MNDIYSSKANCDIAIYGSSRAWVHIDPAIIGNSLQQRVYNFGIDGHNFWLQYLRHLELLKYNDKPKKIILSLDIFSLEKRPDMFHSDQFLPYMLLNKNVRKFTSSYVGYDLPDYYVPLLRYAGKTQALNNSIHIALSGAPKSKYRQSGYRGVDAAWNNDLAAAKAKKSSYEVRLDQQSVVLFEAFIQECKAMEIQLVMVYSPEYIEGQKFVSNRKQIMDLYNDISQKHHIALYDYSSDSICFDKSMFYNASHLNKTGSGIFSRKLGHDLKAN